MWELLLHGILSVCMPAWVSVLLSTPFLWKQLSLFKQTLMSIICSLSLVTKIKWLARGQGEGWQGKSHYSLASWTLTRAAKQLNRQASKRRPSLGSGPSLALTIGIPFTFLLHLSRKGYPREVLGPCHHWVTAAFLETADLY